MNRAGGEEHMQPPARGIPHCLRRELDVVAIATRETAYGGTVHLARNGIHAFPITAGCCGETRFDDVDPELGKGARDTKLFALSHAAARGLLTIAQGGVEDQQSIW